MSGTNSEFNQFMHEFRPTVVNSMTYWNVKPFIYRVVRRKVRRTGANVLVDQFLSSENFKISFEVIIFCIMCHFIIRHTYWD